MGAGHFSKMVHNGIEYAVMQAYAEGWELLDKAQLLENVTEVFRSWREGTVIRSWLLDLLVAALDEDPGLARHPGLRRRLGRGPVDRRGRHRARRRHPRHHGRALRPVRLATGRLAGDEGGRRDAQPVRRARHADRAPQGGDVRAVRPTSRQAQQAGAGSTREPRRASTTCTSRTCTLHDFRSYADLDVELGPGATAFLGRNGQGKTNLVEAIDYLSRLGSHRVSSDAPLVRAGADQAIVRAAIVRDGRSATLEVEINPGRSNRARVNRSPLPKARDLLGLVRTVVFSPDDLTLVKGDPADRRKFLDDLLVLRTPRLAGVRSDYDRVLRQRNSLLKTAGLAARQRARGGDLDPRRVGRPPGPHRRRAARGAAVVGRAAAALPRQGLRDRGPWGDP